MPSLKLVGAHPYYTRCGSGGDTSLAIRPLFREHLRTKTFRILSLTRSTENINISNITPFNALIPNLAVKDATAPFRRLSEASPFLPPNHLVLPRILILPYATSASLIPASLSMLRGVRAPSACRFENVICYRSIGKCTEPSSSHEHGQCSGYNLHESW